MEKKETRMNSEETRKMAKLEGQVLDYQLYVAQVRAFFELHQELINGAAGLGRRKM